MPELFMNWGFWYAVGIAIVLVAATLLIAILLAARGIEREAVRALAALQAIEGNTRAIWNLAGALEGLEKVRDLGGAVEAKAAHLAAALHGETGAPKVER